MSADLAVYASDPSGLDSLDRQSVVALLERGKTWLTMAVERDAEIGDLVEFKGQAETVRVYTVQKQLGKDAELAAAELVRRAEHGIARGIRRGQEAGEIRKRGDDARTDLDGRNHLVSPTAFLSKDELYGNGAGVMHLADATDEQLNSAIEEAKAENNVSRANVVRKVTGRNPAKSTRPEVLRKTRRIDSHRVIAATVDAAAYAVNPSLLAEINLAELEAHDLGEWISSLSESIRALRSLKTTLEKELSQRG